MSDTRAVEAVTETLRDIVDAAAKAAVPGAAAVARPPDQMAADVQDPRVNLFLYQTEIDPALRNTDPYGTRPGERAQPALPLVLRYLLTPYASDGDELLAHRLLGAGIGALHAHDVLTGPDLTVTAPYSDVGRQHERVRITWQPLDDKDIHSIWSVLQAPYRLSVAFEVRVVQIDGRRPALAPLPVLTRGADDRGPVAAASTDSPVAGIDAVGYPDGRPAARTGDVVVLRGRGLGATSAVAVMHPALAAPVEVVPDAITDTEVTLTVPDTVPAGLCSASTVAGPGAPTVGDVYLVVAPTLGGVPVAVARDAGGAVAVDVTCTPDVLAGQRVALLLGGRVVPAAAASTGSALTFDVPAADPGAHPARLRVDGVDSLLVADETATPPAFDATQTVTVT